MKIFVFIQKNSSAVLTLSAEDLHKALIELEILVKNSINWKIDNEEGEDE